MEKNKRLLIISIMALTLSSCSNNKQKSEWVNVSNQGKIVCSSFPSISRSKLTKAYENDKIIEVGFEKKKGKEFIVTETLYLKEEGYKLAERETHFKALRGKENRTLILKPIKTRGYQESVIGRSKWPIPHMSIKDIAKLIGCTG